MIRLDNIEVSFGDFIAIPRLDLHVQPGEFFTLLGPSGCGKTTALRTLAGFIEPSAGTVHVDGRDVTRLASDKRQVGMVFQNYALFPSMSVRDNIAFGLRVRKEKSAESDRLVRDIARRVELSDEQLDKNVAELSGGQQQRVAVARALVLRPKILLLDEPLSNLDAKLRHQLRQQLKDLQSEFGITTVYVTHDQDEALAMSDRVAVFNKGAVEQIGTPQAIYDHSATEFVCKFIGDSSVLTPEFVAELNRLSGAGLHTAANSYLRVEKASLTRPAASGTAASGTAAGGTAVGLAGEVVSRTYHGLHSRYVVRSHGADIRLLVKEDGGAHPAAGAQTTVYVQPDHVLQYHPDTGVALAAHDLAATDQAGQDQAAQDQATAIR
ncbi:ABC transporter ATP-binding protein [Arthrobacter oryzae]|jgi:iron(III) transport system ATP-binding protein|uniref:ABC transporter ATP-binding protein n=1 Tax=Arthrobacter oryzae TaxID=409290 RepID=UPI00277F9BE4|nr:ABC transporter ATP-binding protein [Arthrobacter oryzae]MDQ0077478.1 iron(III) transport system ATP-binding protein [Arthrobacter oryzae]